MKLEKVLPNIRLAHKYISYIKITAKLAGRAVIFMQNLDNDSD